jgi:type III pantothenate kinase
MKLTVIDIGNTNTRIAEWDGVSLSHRISISTAKMTSKKIPLETPAAISCVVPQIKSKIKGKNILWINAMCGAGLDFSAVDRPAIGSDRVAGAVASAKFAKLPAIIVDIGTAITVDALAKGGVFLGGAILPGRTMMKNALSRGTAQLPSLKTSSTRNPRFAGKKTADAITSGVENGIVGSLKYLVSGIAEECRFSKYSIVLTGGDSSFFIKNLPHCNYIKDLILLGTAIIWERHFTAIRAKQNPPPST